MTEVSRTPLHVWIVGGVSALWNAGGAYDYIMTQARDPSYLAQLTDAQRAYMESLPIPMSSAWAIGVWGAVAGSLLLLARSRHAAAGFGLSLAGLLVTTIYQYLIHPLPADMTSGPRTAFTLAIWVVAIALLFYTVRMKRNGVLR